MRKTTKWAVVLGAAAVMTFGACMTSFAAANQWVEEGGEWFYYDRDEEAVTDTWRKGADNKFYYLGEDGAMVTSSWVESTTDDAMYYVNTHGVRVTNEWRFMYSYDDDADEENWFWFDASGKMARTKKTVNGKTYFFDQDGEMLTGWVLSEEDSAPVQFEDTISKGAKVYYCLDSGERATGWMKLYAPDDEDEEDDEAWYSFKSSGVARISEKATISGKSYIFGDDGKMLSGWVESYVDASGSDAFIDHPDNGDGATVNEYEELLFCGTADDGAVKKNTWFEYVEPGNDAEDTDEDRYWYYANKSGKLYVAGSDDVGPAVNAKKAKDRDVGKNADTFTGDTIQVGFKKIGSKYYAFDNKARMVSGLINVIGNQIDYAPGVYYFGKSSDGAMKTSSASITNDDDVSYAYSFLSKADKNGNGNRGLGVTGVINGKLYQDGRSLAAKEDSDYEVFKPTSVTGDTFLGYFIVNESGRVMTSTSTSREYTASNGVKYRNNGQDASDDGSYNVEMLLRGTTTWVPYQP